MALKNIVEANLRKFENMPTFLYNSRFIIAILCAAILLMSGCKKSLVQQVSEQTLQSYFETNILNKNYIVDLAKDTTTDITSRFIGFTFVLTKESSYTEGPMTATKDGVTYTGRWTSNSDYGKLDININTPFVPAELVFMNRNWRFVKKDIPVMQLAPWGTTDPKVLNMRRL